MGQGRVSSCKLRCELRSPRGKDTNGANPHQGAIRLAFDIPPTPSTQGIKTRPRRATYIERLRISPRNIFLGYQVAVEVTIGHEAAGKRERQLAVIGRLSSESIPRSAGTQIHDPMRVMTMDLSR